MVKSKFSFVLITLILSVWSIKLSLVNIKLCLSLSEILFFPQNPKFQEPVTLDFLDAELENDIKIEV